MQFVVAISDLCNFHSVPVEMLQDNQLVDYTVTCEGVVLAKSVLKVV